MKNKNKKMMLFIKIDKFNHFENIPTFLKVSKSMRMCVFKHSDEIIEHLLKQSDALPKWCYIQIPLLPIYPTLHEKIQLKINQLFPKTPSFLNVKNGFLAGGSVCRFAFDKEWETKDLDIFVKENTKNPEYKRVKIYLDNQTNFLDLVFRNESISSFDISVCQIGMNLDTRLIYVTPLFLYSFLTQKMIIKVSDLSAQYWRNQKPVVHLLKLYNRHLDYHTVIFHSCTNCKNTVKNDLENNEEITRWFDRVDKYLKRFKGWGYKYVK
jgi:hypothetical protein